MSMCPHCKAKIQPMRLFFSWRWSSYQCLACGGYSEIPARDRMLFSGLPAGLSVLPLGLLLYSMHLDGVALYLSVAFGATVVVLIITQLLARFARFEPLPSSHEPSA